MSFINEYLIEVNEFPVYADGSYTIKDFFFYDSNIKEYGDRNLIVPSSKVSNSNDIPSKDIMKFIINNNIPAMQRRFDTEKNIEMWIFNTKSLEEIKND
jgi:hypothetical protein